MQRQKYVEDKGADEWERELNNLKAAEFKVWQEEDETLKDVWRAADGMVTVAGEGFFRRDGVTYRKWMPKEGIVTGEVPVGAAPETQKHRSQVGAEYSVGWTLAVYTQTSKFIPPA